MRKTRRVAQPRKSRAENSNCEWSKIRMAVHIYPGALRPGQNGGAEGSRTPDLSSAIAALSQLSYGPTRRRALGPC